MKRKVPRWTPEQLDRMRLDRRRRFLLGVAHLWCGPINPAYRRQVHGARAAKTARGFVWAVNDWFRSVDTRRTKRTFHYVMVPISSPGAVPQCSVRRLVVST